MKTCVLALTLGGVIVDGGTAAAAPEIDSGKGDDRIVITVERNADRELASQMRYKLVFVSRKPSQDRTLKETSQRTAVRAFNTSTTVAQPGIGERATLTFEAYYSSILGTFLMNNGASSWTVHDIDPGDAVTVVWGDN